MASSAVPVVLIILLVVGIASYFGYREWQKKDKEKKRKEEEETEAEEADAAAIENKRKEEERKRKEKEKEEARVWTNDKLADARGRLWTVAKPPEVLATGVTDVNGSETLVFVKDTAEKKPVIIRFVPTKNPKVFFLELVSKNNGNHLIQMDAAAKSVPRTKPVPADFLLNSATFDPAGWWEAWLVEPLAGSKTQFALKNFAHGQYLGTNQDTKIPTTLEFLRVTP